MVDSVNPVRIVPKSFLLHAIFCIFFCPDILLLHLLEDYGREILSIKTTNL